MASRRSLSVRMIRLDRTMAMVPVGARRKSSSDRPNRFGTSATAMDKSGALLSP